MNKKKWLLLLLCGIVLFGYVKFFYKTWTEKVVPQNADGLVALDIKRITNTVIWNTLKAPSQWKIGNIFSGRKKGANWKDMIKVPDYILAFHVTGQPADVWHAAFDIESEDGLKKGLQQYGFIKTGEWQYVNLQYGIRIFKSSSQVLVTVGATKNYEYQLAAADELFTRKKFIAKERLQKLIDTKSHFAMDILPGEFLQQTAFIAGNLDDRSIKFEGIFTPGPKYSFSQTNFQFAEQSIFTMAFTQPSPEVAMLLSDSAKNKISKALNLNTDSMFFRRNERYQVELMHIASRTDSAVTYEYDDDFNKTEKIVVNQVREPVFNFSIYGDSAAMVYNYLLHNEKLEDTKEGMLFTPMPFARSYAGLNDKKDFFIGSPGYKPPSREQQIACIFFYWLNLENIPADMMKFLPDNIFKAVSNLKSVKITVDKQNSQVEMKCVISKKDNDLPILKL